MDIRAEKWIGSVRGRPNANVWVGGIAFDSNRVDGSGCRLLMVDSSVVH